MPGPSALIVLLGIGLALLQSGATPRDTAAATPVRFHHVHYRVDEPALAMNELARATGGVRVIAPGLGVGVRVDREYALFDRRDVGEREVAKLDLPKAWDAAVRWLTSTGVLVEQPVFDEIGLVRHLPTISHDHVAFAAVDLQAVEARLVTSARVIRRSDDAILFQTADRQLVEIVRDLDREDLYWCPMHPDVRSPDAGTCPVCGMDLVAIPPPKIGEYRIDVTQILDQRLATNGLDIVVREPGTDVRVTKFVVMHEKLFHLFVVSRDLRYFAHVHPEPQPDGSFRLTHPLAPGPYMLIADFLPEGGTAQMVQRAIIVSGPPRSLAVTDETGGLRVLLETEDLAAARHAVLRFTVTDAATGRPVTDLEPYLGAPAHMLMVRSDLGDAVHAHPEELETRGPTVSFHPVVPSAGEYRVWIQFQRGGKVSTHRFALTVPPL